MRFVPLLVDADSAGGHRFGMTIRLYHHPFSRAANVVWMLEEVGVEYDLHFVDIFKGEHKSAEILGLNPMGKVPILVDGDVPVTESAAIGLYLADRYGPGRLCPDLDAPARGTYLRWSLFAPSVIEPAVAAHAANWPAKESQVGWGNYDAVLNSMESATSACSFLLGETFSMADIIFGGTLRFMLQTKMLEARPAFLAYCERLEKRPALIKADAINTRVAIEHNLGPS